MIELQQAIQIFFYGLALDLLFTWYIRAAGKSKKLQAATYSVGAAAVSVFGTISVYEERWLAVPYFFGLFVGTILALSIGDEYKK